MAALPSSCSSCGSANINQFCFKLECNHNLCVPCFSKLSSNRGCDPFFSCPIHSCSHVSNSWNLCEHKESFKHTRSGLQIAEPYTDNTKFQIRKPDLLKEPKQYHQNLEFHEIYDTCILSITYPKLSPVTGCEVLACIAAEMRGKNADKDWGDKTKNNIEAIFQVLNQYLVRSGHDEDNSSENDNNDNDEIDPEKDSDSFFSGNYESLDDIATEDSKLVLNRCIYALGMGNVTSSQPNDTVLWKNLLCQSFTASDIVRNLSAGHGKKSGRLKKKVAGQLISCCASKALWKILSKLGIAPSQDFIRLGEDSSGLDKLQKGLRCSCHDLILILYDNLGFRKKGSVPGFEQFTAIQLATLPKELLQLWGIYPTPDNPHTLSRIRKCWEDERANVSFDDVMGIKQEDNDQLAQSVISGIDTILKLEAMEGLPTLKEARELIANDAERSEVSFSTEMVEEKGVRKLANPDQPSSEVITVTSNVREEEVDMFQTSLDANNSIVDRPMKADLNAKSTVKSLMNYGLEIRTNVLASAPESEWWKEQTPILQDYALPLLGDGSPTYAISTILRTDAAKKYEGKVTGFGGGFHLLLETHRKRGSLFGASHLEDLFSTWRTTQGQLKWVLEPGDPGQIDAELIMVVLALYTVAIREEAKRRAKKAHENGEAHFKMCAADVIDSMTKRALEHPLMLVMLIELRLAELTFMLHEAERKGDAGIYITAKKYLAALFAISHATKYVSMTIDFFVSIFCFSDADRMIFEKGIFVRKTKNGRTIFSDRFVEWMMKDFRTWLGKMASANTESMVSRCALNMNERKKERVFGRSELKLEDQPKKSGSQAKPVELDHVYCQVLTFATEANLYGDGPLRHLPKGPMSKRNPTDMDPEDAFFSFEENEFSTICSKPGKPTHLNKEMLSLYSTGRERLESYFDLFLKNGDLTDPKRSEKEVSLSAIDPIMSASDKKDELDLERGIATEADIISKNYTNAELKEEIRQLNEQNIQLREALDNSLPTFTPSSIGGTKAELVAKVVILRFGLIRLNENWQSERKQEIQARLNERSTNQSSTMRNDMAKELENSLYTLNGATAKRESNENSIEFEVKNYFTAVENDDDEDRHLGGVNLDLGDDDDDNDAIRSPPA